MNVQLAIELLLLAGVFALAFWPGKGEDQE